MTDAGEAAEKEALHIVGGVDSHYGYSVAILQKIKFITTVQAGSPLLGNSPTQTKL